jgi:putative Holliday junction resolvase
MVIKGKILGIDYGDVRIGIAVSDVDQTIAFGRKAIKNLSYKQVIEEIVKICKEEKIVQIIIGLPLGLDGRKTDQTKKVEFFVSKLKEHLDIPINYQDERLTTKESNGILTTLKIRRKEKKFKKQQKDIIAASLILQNYLNLINGKDERGRGL